MDFNYHSIRSYTSYSCVVQEGTVEKEISFHVDLGPSTERRGDVFPVYEVPDDKMVWLSDWSLNSGGPLNRAVSVGGSLGRVARDSTYIYVLNCSVSAGEMEIYSPARPIRYLGGEWLAVCLHHMGKPLDLQVRATFRLTEVTSPGALKTETFNWWAKDKNDLFLGQTQQTDSPINSRKYVKINK